MKDFFSDYKLEGDNKYECSKWQTYTNATKSVSIEDEPVNLIINLKRFDKFGSKIKSGIDYPITFQLNDYIKSKGSKKSSSATYELYAVINHEGKFSNKGHYNCMVRGYDKYWYVCDDSTITKIGNNPKKSTKAYILFYKLSEGHKIEKLAQRRISDVSTNDMDSDEQLVKIDKPKSPIKVNRKRKRIITSSTLVSKNKDKSNASIKRRHKAALKAAEDWSAEHALDCSMQLGTKRLKVEDQEYYDNTTEVSIGV